MAETKPNFQVPNLERALQILDYLVENQDEKSQREIAMAMGFPVNSVMRILNALEYYGYVERNINNKKYTLTHKLTSMGNNCASNKSLMEVSMDIMKKLRDEFSETVVLSIIDNGQGLVLDQVQSIHPFRFVCNPGTKQVIHCSASCKAILAITPDKERNSLINSVTFKKLTINTITSKKGFLKELEDVKKKGFALDLAEALDGVHCVAAPILDNTGNAIAAITITAPSSRMPKTLLVKIGKQLRKEALAISKRLGFYG